MAEESVEVLEFIGFVADVARLIYDRYLNRPNPAQNPDDLMAYVSGHIGSLKSSRYDNMSHSEALSQIGLNLQIQEAITDPIFAHVFGTQTLHYWAKNTVENNYAALLGRQDLLKSYANQRMTHKKKNKRPRLEGGLPQEQGPSQQPAVTATINMTPRDFQFPEGHVVMQSDVDILGDHVSLYKGKAHMELKHSDEIINNDGSVNLSPLSTHPGGDFNWNFSAHYWTPEKETAEEYRKYAARRCPTVDTCMVHIQIPWSFIHGLHREELWYSPNWKEYIWTCRKGRRPNQKYDHLWERGQADVVRGHVCSTTSGQINRIREENVQTNINEENAMRLPSGKKASQWMFLQNNTIDRLAEEIRGKMHFTIFEATARSPTTTA